MFAAGDVAEAGAAVVGATAAGAASVDAAAVDAAVAGAVAGGVAIVSVGARKVGVDPVLGITPLFWAGACPGAQAASPSAATSARAKIDQVMCLAARFKRVRLTAFIVFYPFLL